MGALERVHRLRDGTLFRLRPLGPADAEELRAGFARLSPASRYRRFFTPIQRLPESMLRRLTATDGWNHVALVAETIPVYDEPPEPLGVGRFIRLANRPNVAEVALEVIDEKQGRGLGSVLLEALAELARAEGVTIFVATVLAENEPMHRLVRSFGPVVSVTRDGGTYEYEVRIGRRTSRAA
ncbi:MAG TPA: GNAT family N-acetyltransferase [Candidatus Binatia bacterium]